jgi:hypothetical protein
VKSKRFVEVLLGLEVDWELGGKDREGIGWDH